MNFLFVVFVLSHLIDVLVAATTRAEPVITLNDESFTTQIKSGDFYVVFERDGPVHEFSHFWKKVAKTHTHKEDVKFARVDCRSSSKTCHQHNVSELLTVIFFPKEGSTYNWESRSSFFNSTVAKITSRFMHEKETIDQLKSGLSLVEFYASTCTHCKDMAKVWHKLEKFYKKDREIKLLSINCNRVRSLCHKYNVRNYPTILWIDNGKAIKKFGGERSVQGFQEFIEKMLIRYMKPNLSLVNNRVRRDTSTVPATELTQENFKENISKDFTFIMFYLHQCPYCVDLYPVFDELVKKFANHDTIKIAQVDCNLYPSLCANEAKGCPTLNYYKDGIRIVKDYYEDQTLEGLSDCIISNMKGGQDQINWKLGEKEKRRIRKAYEKTEEEAQNPVSQCPPQIGPQCAC